MSERIEGTAFAAASRGCGIVALCIGGVVNALGDMPILALKAGGVLSLLVTFGLLLQASRAERTCFTKTRLWRQLEGRDRPAMDRAQEVISGARQKALHRCAQAFALAAAVFLAITLAGEINLWLYPPH